MKLSDLDNRLGQYWGNIRHGKSLIEPVGEGFQIVLKQPRVGVQSHFRGA